MNTGENQPPPSGNAAGNQPETLSDADRAAIREARRIGPRLRASRKSDDRLAGWLLKELADALERVTQEGGAS